LQPEEAVTSAIKEFELQVGSCTAALLCAQQPCLHMTVRCRAITHMLGNSIIVRFSCSTQTVSFLQGYNLDGIIKSTTGGNTDRCVSN